MSLFRSMTAQCGASMTEFVVVAPTLLLLGLGTVQAGLVYHAKTILNYATFEAARTGATRHAMPAPMRRELGIRLAPLIGGDGSIASAASAIASSIIDVESPVAMDGTRAPATRLEILNPTAEAFQAWGRPSLEYESRVAIPNSHLRHQPDTTSSGEGGVTLRDANLLKIEVTHGYELKVPVVAGLMRAIMPRFDPANALYYRASRLPLKAVATVRMQSEAWQQAFASATTSPPSTTEPVNEIEEPGPVSVAPDGEASEASEVVDETVPDGREESSPTECGLDGLPFDVPLSASAYADGTCSVVDTAYETPESERFETETQTGTTPVC